MGFSDRATSAQLNLTGAVSALTYGFPPSTSNTNRAFFPIWKF